jgi:DNA-binding NarL/FixJ family response regulator
MQVFMLLVAGHPVSDIAAELDVHSCTISNHLARIREKLGAATVADLVRYAHATGLSDPGPALPR